jgi:quercetin dioxygenase-like cupin family protein
MANDKFFPDIITNLPEADIPIDGLHTHLFQGAHQQFVFMSFDSDVEIHQHSHEAQWGVVLDGEIELTINGDKLTYKKGDTYYISENTPHSAKVRAGYKDLTLFNQKDRYKAKESLSNT